MTLIKKIKSLFFAYYYLCKLIFLGFCLPYSSYSVFTTTHKWDSVTEKETELNSQLVENQSSLLIIQKKTKIFYGNE